MAAAGDRGGGVADHPRPGARLTPLEVQAASYLAASVRMASLSRLHAVHRAAAALGAIQPVDDMNGAAGEESHAHHHHNKSKVVIVHTSCETFVRPSL